MRHTPHLAEAQPQPMVRRPLRLGVALLCLFSLVQLQCSGGSGGGRTIGPPPERSLDLATLPSSSPTLLRVHGSVGNGSLGVPVTGGHDVDGDGLNDVALAAMRADPQGRTNAGEVFLAFGDGTLSGPIDTFGTNARILRVQGGGGAGKRRR